jgi:hypothetical protein
VSLPVRRPFGISFLSILVMIAGALDILASIVILLDRNDDELLDTLHVSQGNLTTYAFVSLGLGIIVVLVGYALRQAANWARLVIAIIAVARLITVLWVVISLHTVHWYQAIWPAVIYMLVAGYLLFDDDAKAYFSKGVQ